MDYFLAKQVSDNIANTTEIKKVVWLCFCFLNLFYLTTKIKSQNTIIPFEELLKRPVNLRLELKGVHLRLFFTVEDLPRLKAKAKGIDKELWAKVLQEVKSFKSDVPDVNNEDLYKSVLAERKKNGKSLSKIALQEAK